MRIAVIMPAFNAAAFIGDAIRSLRAQSHAGWQLVVVDDGSGDDTVGVVGGFADARIHLLRQTHAGVSAARNRGLADADADAFLFLDADDWLAPGALAALARALARHPAAVAAAGAARFVTPDGSPGRRPLPAVQGDLLPRLLWRNRFANGGQLLIRADAVRRAGLFRTDLAYGEDWEYWVRLALLGRFVAARHPHPLLFVRQRAEGACLRQAADPAAIRACHDAMFGNPQLAQRIPLLRLGRLRARAEAENAWVVGRALHARGERAAGRAWMLRSVLAAPSLRRAALLAGTGLFGATSARA